MPALPVALELRVAEALAGLPGSHLVGLLVGPAEGTVTSSTWLKLPRPSLRPNPYSESVSTKLMLLWPLTSG